MQLKISRWIYFGVIVSFFFVMVFGAHVGGPLVLFEVFMLIELPNVLQQSGLIDFLPNLLLVIGQLLFLFLGWRTVKNYKLWLLLSSPLCIITYLITYAMSLDQFRAATLQSMIPFFSMTIVFYVYCFMKLKNPSNSDHV